MNQAALGRAPSLRAADVVALVKPRIMLMALLTAAGGAALAGTPSAGHWLALLVGTGLIVGSANTLNMYLERDIDCLMARTKGRPLPGRRMDPNFALAFGVAQALASVPILTFALNPLTGFLGVFALISYVNVYTPLKQRTTLATLIGAVPGAMPPLMGWTAVTGSLDAGGLAVFALLFFWQIPHFHAIALFRQKDYDRAGLVTLPSRRGSRGTRLTMVAYLALQLGASVAVYATGVAGAAYLAVAVGLGAVYLVHGLAGLRDDAGPRWARGFFLHSIAHLPLVFLALILNGAF